MKIGVIVAMRKELDLLLHIVDGVKTVTANETEFHVGQIGDHQIVAMQCGIGKVNAAIGSLTLIENFHPALVVNSGVAGGTGHGAGILDVVVGERVAYHDTYCGPGTVWGEVSGLPRYFTPPSSLLALDVFDRPGVRRGLICSGDFFVSSPAEVERIKEIHPDAEAVDMESASIAHVCHLKGVPFLCARVISDTPGAADNISQYESFWDDAPRHTFELLTALFKAI